MKNFISKKLLILSIFILTAFSYADLLQAIDPWGYRNQIRDIKNQISTTIIDIDKINPSIQVELKNTADQQKKLNSLNSKIASVKSSIMNQLTPKRDELKLIIEKQDNMINSAKKISLACNFLHKNILDIQKSSLSIRDSYLGLKSIMPIFSNDDANRTLWLTIIQNLRSQNTLTPSEALSLNAIEESIDKSNGWLWFKKELIIIPNYTDLYKVFSTALNPDLLNKLEMQISKINASMLVQVEILEKVLKIQKDQLQLLQNLMDEVK